ncbi:hypothetical protein Hypma_005212, partial [Hypsizygus marmoreus]
NLDGDFKSNLVQWESEKSESSTLGSQQNDLPIGVVLSGLGVNNQVLEHYRALKRKLSVETGDLEKQEEEAMMRTQAVRKRWEEAKLEQERKFRKFQRLRAACADLDRRRNDLSEHIKEIDEEVEDMESDLARWYILSGAADE